MDGGNLLDVHRGAADAWDLDAASFFASIPPYPSLLSPSPPQPPPPPPLPPTSLLRILGDRSTEFSGKFDSQMGDKDTQNEKIMLFSSSAMDSICDSSYIIKERMTQALRHFKELTNQHVLVQVWAPINNRDQYVLTTSEQPFVLDPCSNGLLQYRTVSTMYLFSVDESSGGALGLPGRVFNKKLPEWTPNVQYYSCTEYPRLNHALLHNVRGSLALPVFETSQQSCVGVVELIMTSQKVNYAPEVDKLCRALEAVNLKSSEILEHQSIQICNEGCQAALAEILDILAVVCEAQKLPLAQTWVPCQHGSVLAHHGGSRKICSSFDGNCMRQVCMSTSHAAFYVVDAHMWGFRDACSEHHLQKGQGVAGRAFAAQRPCFCHDITQFCKREYPLVHYARMFGLGSCLAVCLQSSHSKDDTYVVEFFLPLGCHDVIKQHAVLESISTLMKQNLRSLKVITSGKLQERLPLEMIDMISYENYEMKHTQYLFPETVALEGTGEYANKCKQHLMSCIYSEKNLAAFPENVSIPALNNGDQKVPERKRGKGEKIISLEVLQQYFSGSLKDAAKSLGVCPTTMKRICRHHGISRWPCRKINKVNRSLSKLKRVIESVQGTNLALNLNSLACPLPIAAGSMSLHVLFDEFAHTQGSVARNKDPSPIKALATDDPYHKLTAKEPVDSHSAPFSKARSFFEGAVKITASQGSCHANSGNEVSEDKQKSPPNSEQLVCMDNFLEDQNMVPLLSLDDITVAKAEYAESSLPIEGSASSKEAKNLPTTATSAPKAVIIKACYKEDIIRFRMASGISIVALNEEVAKRLKLEVGTFDIKYLDDDHEWVNLACDADLEECMEISTMAGAEVIRLSVHGIPTHISSSCESSSK